MFLIYSLVKRVSSIILKCVIKTSSESTTFYRIILKSRYFIKITFQFTPLNLFLILSAYSICYNS